MEEKLKILLCEDDENLGMLLREYLQAKGYIATLCPDGEEGYKEFLKDRYDICVLDVMMPKKRRFYFGAGDKTSQCGNAYHLPYSQGIERRYTRRFQDWSRRLYY